MSTKLEIVMLVWKIALFLMPALSVASFARFNWLIRNHREAEWQSRIIAVATLCVGTLTVVLMATIIQEDMSSALWSTPNTMQFHSHVAAAIMKASAAFSNGTLSTAMCLGLWLLLPRKTNLDETGQPTAKDDRLEDKTKSQP